MVVVLIGPSFVGKSTMAKYMRVILQGYSIFSTDEFKRHCAVFSAEAINNQLTYQIEHSHGNLIVDVGSCTLLDFKEDELKDFLTRLPKESKICLLTPYQNKEKSRTLLYNQVDLLYGNKSGAEIIKKNIDEELDSNLYNEICTESLHTADENITPFMSMEKYKTNISNTAKNFCEQIKPREF